MNFEEKTLLITGASSGIGRAIALNAASKGGLIINADIQPQPRGDEDVRTDEKIEETGGEARYVETDVTDLEAVRDAVAVAMETFGSLDVIVNNAGRAQSYAITDTETENWHNIVQLNLTGVYHGSLAAIEQMRADDGGAIVNIGSVFGIVGGPNSASYSAAKGGVIALTRQIARDYARDDIRANVVSPGFVNTPMFRKDTHDGTHEFAKTETPMNRIGKPDELAEAVLFLASENASFITGQNLAVDGGFSTS